MNIMNDLKNILKGSNPLKFTTGLKVITAISAFSLFINFKLGTIVILSMLISIGIIKAFGGKATLPRYLIAGVVALIVEYGLLLLFPNILSSLEGGITSLLVTSLILSTIVAIVNFKFVYAVPTKNLIKAVIYYVVTGIICGLLLIGSLHYADSFSILKDNMGSVLKM